LTAVPNCVKTDVTSRSKVAEDLDGLSQSVTFGALMDVDHFLPHISGSRSAKVQILLD
jgi:hypothetical protein